MKPRFGRNFSFSHLGQFFRKKQRIVLSHVGNNWDFLGFKVF
jgi:hypothetical protein